MKYLIYLSISFLSLTSTVALSQTDKEYEARKKKAADEKALQKYMDDRIPVSGSGASTSKYGFEIAREKRERQEEIARNRAERQVIIDEERERTKEKEAAEREHDYQVRLAVSERQAPFRQAIESSGYFSYKSINKLMAIGTYENGNTKPEAEQYKLLPLYYADYLAIAETGTFEEVRDAIAKFEIVFEEAFIAIGELRKRFPEREKELAIITMLAFENGRYRTSLATEEQRREFERLFLEYPEEFFSIVPIGERSSIVNEMSSCIFYFKDKFPSDATGLLKLEKTFVDFTSNEMLIEYAHDVAREYLEQLSDDEVWEIAQSRRVSAGMLTILKNYVAYDGYFKLSKIKNSPYKEGLGYLTKAQQNRLKEFAYRGDPESGALYGVRILEGFTKEKKENALSWLQKAVEEKTPHAQENMEVICSYDIKAWKKTVCN